MSDNQIKKLEIPTYLNEEQFLVSASKGDVIDHGEARYEITGKEFHMMGDSPAQYKVYMWVRKI
ncbi:hypothetical protein D9M71_760070 [compost metagenome]